MITGPGGVGIQETGKTTLAEKLSALAGGVFRVTLEQQGDAVGKQLVSDPAMRRRVVLLDNLDEGLVTSRELAELVTAEEIHGRPAFGRQRMRPNRLTWTATAVSPSLSQDLASRAMILELEPPDRAAPHGWEEQVDGFLEEHRAELVADCVALLRGRKFTLEGDPGRFPSWSRGVLATHAAARHALDAQGERIQTVDYDLENLQLLLEHINGPGFYSKAKMAELWEKATGRRVTTTWLTRKLRALQRRGKLPPGFEEHRTDSRRGWQIHPEVGLDFEVADSDETPAERCTREATKHKEREERWWGGEKQ